MRNISASEQSRFVSTGSGADFKHDVFLVVGILWQEHKAEFIFNARYTRFQLVEFFLGVGTHVAISFLGDHSTAFGNAPLRSLYSRYFSTVSEISL